MTRQLNCVDGVTPHPMLTSLAPWMENLIILPSWPATWCERLLKSMYYVTLTVSCSPARRSVLARTRLLWGEAAPSAVTVACAAPPHGACGKVTTCVTSTTLVLCSCFCLAGVYRVACQSGQPVQYLARWSADMASWHAVVVVVVCLEHTHSTCCAIQLGHPDHLDQHCSSCFAVANKWWTRVWIPVEQSTYSLHCHL